MISIGTDIEEVSRFEGKTQDELFLRKIYTSKEISYCLKHKHPALHLCARYCAKEAVVKALSDFEVKDVYYGDIEILNREDGSPYVILDKYPDLRIKVSLSHCKTYATATALVYIKPLAIV